MCVFSSAIKSSWISSIASISSSPGIYRLFYHPCFANLIKSLVDPWVPGVISGGFFISIFSTATKIHTKFWKEWQKISLGGSIWEKNWHCTLKIEIIRMQKCIILLECILNGPCSLVFSDAKSDARSDVHRELHPIN